MAEYMNVDPAWVRIAWLALLVTGPGLFLYIIAWIAIPEAAATAAPAPRSTTSKDTGRFLVGGLLIVIGGSLLAKEYLPWIKELVFPVILIAVGAGVVVYSVKK